MRCVGMCFPPQKTYKHFSGLCLWLTKNRTIVPSLSDYLKYEWGSFFFSYEYTVCICRISQKPTNYIYCEVNDVFSLCFAPKALFISSYTCELSTSTSTWPLVVMWVTACKMWLCHHRLSRIHRAMRKLGKVWLVKPYLLSQICVHFLASLSLCRESDNGNSTTAGATEALLCCPQKKLLLWLYLSVKKSRKNLCGSLRSGYREGKMSAIKKARIRSTDNSCSGQFNCF